MRDLAAVAGPPIHWMVRIGRMVPIGKATTYGWEGTGSFHSPTLETPTTMTLRLAIATLAILLLSATATAQVDWYQEFLNSSVLSDDTRISLAGNVFYFAVNNVPGDKGVREDGSLGNGTYVVDGYGNVTDCTQSPAECMDILNGAVDGGGVPSEPPSGGDSPPGENPPASPPPDGQTPPEEQAEEGTYWAWFGRFELQRDGSLRYDASGTTTRGAWGLVLTKTWFANRRTRGRR